MNREVRRLSRHHARALEEQGVALVRRRARLLGGGRIETDDGEVHAARRIVIATGSEPVRPRLPGARHALVSDDLFHMGGLPNRLAILGGGYIACEFACLLSRFGVAVTILQAGPRLLEGFDAEIAGLLTQAMAGQGIDVRLGHRAEAIVRSGEAFTVRTQAGRLEGFDAVLLAVGRRPATRGLGLADAGVETDESGAIRADARGRTGAPSIHAVGDVVGRLPLTPVAIREARRAADDALGRAPALPEAAMVPTAAFTSPEIASVGLGEEEADRQGLVVEVRRSRFRPLAALLSGGEQEVLMKVVLDPSTGVLLGFHFCGPGASEAAQMGAMALGAGLTARELRATMPLHPTIAEELIGLGEPDDALRPQGNAPVIEDEAETRSARARRARAA